MLHHSFFENYQIILFYTSIILMVVSLVLFQSEQYKISTLILFSGSLLLGIFLASINPYLNYWDEQYHALVAKNMLEHPFTPMLFKNPQVPYTIELWTGNHIWLHKQPLFLWLMSISLKIFGVNAFAVRFPSVLFHALTIFLIYRIGSLSHSKKLGFYAAFLYTFSFYMIELMVGCKVCDHNDTIFIFFATASFWAWFEYQEKPSLKWIIAIGLFSGGAMLTKWLVGLLVYAGWGLTTLLSKNLRFNFNAYLQIIKSFAITLLVFLPWQIYTFIKFPAETKFEFQYNSRHFTEPIEGHGGDWTFHFKSLNALYGEGDLVPWIILIGLILLIFLLKNKQHKIFIFGTVILTYLFYTLAKTKMVSFGLVVSIFVFIALSMFFVQFEQFLLKIIKKKNIVLFLITPILLFTAYLSLNLEQIHYNHTMLVPDKNPTRNLKMKELEFINILPNLVPDTSTVLFNAPYMSEIQIMFFTNYKAVYQHIPSETDCINLIHSKQKFVVFDNGYQEMPAYLAEKNIPIIKNPLWPIY